MRVLALDTTTRTGSVALVEDDRVVSERSGDPSRTHAERLPAELLTLLEACGHSTADIDLFAIASGPGSFTGLRIGIATVQGLAFVHRRRVVTISALEALAQIASRGRSASTMIGAWMDAQRREVFTALYRVGSPSLFQPNRLTEIEPPSVGDPASVLRRWAALVGADSPTFTGDGAVRYAEVICSARAPATSRHAVLVGQPVLAGAIGLMAVARAASGGTIDPASVRPLYVRRSDAELERDRRTFTTGAAKDSL